MDTSTAAGHPWMLYAALVVGILVIIAGAVPKILGPLGEAFDERTKRARAAAAEADDADIAEMDRKIAYLQGRVDEQLVEMRARDVLIAEHVIWDRERLMGAMMAGEDVPPPPPLYPARREITERDLPRDG